MYLDYYAENESLLSWTNAAALISYIIIPIALLLQYPLFFYHKLTSKQSRSLPTRPQRFASDVLDLADLSLRFNLVLLVVPMIKILFSVFALVFSGESCLSLRKIWLLFMTTYDFIYILMIVSRLLTIYKVNKIMERMSRLTANSQENIEIVEREERNNSVPLEFRESENNIGVRRRACLQEISGIITKRARLDFVSKIIFALWFGLFIWGQIIYGTTLVTHCDSQMVSLAMMSFFVLGYGWMIGPAVLCVAACVCLPFVLLALKVFRRPQENLNNQEENVKGLQYLVHSQESNLAEKECSICITQYKDGETLVNLTCNPKHCFHESCVKKWLKINRQCPICRTRIQFHKTELDSF